MLFQYKGKGILVPVIAIVPIIASSLLTKVFEETFFVHKFHGNVYQIAFGIALIVSGFWNNYASEDYYFDDDGEKHFMEFQNQFMWIEMKLFSYVFWCIGAFALIGGIAEVILP